MIHVRGDGNCFYTSFGYQLLRLVIYQYSDQEFRVFLNQNFTIPFKMQLKNEIIGSEEQGSILLQNYKERILYLRNLEQNYPQHVDYSQQLMIHFRAHEQQNDQDGYLQPLTVLFLRNLCMYLVENCEEGQNVFDKEQLLKWEEECNSNEQVVAILAKHFQIHVQLLYFEKKISNYLNTQLSIKIKIGQSSCLFNLDITILVLKIDILNQYKQQFKDIKWNLGTEIRRSPPPIPKHTLKLQKALK